MKVLPEKTLSIKETESRRNFSNASHDTKKIPWEMLIVTEIFRYNDSEVHPRIKLCDKYLRECNNLLFKRVNIKVHPYLDDNSS